MLPKSIVISSLLLGGMAVAGLGTATLAESVPCPRASGRGRGPRPGCWSLGDRRGQRTNHMKQILLACHNYLLGQRAFSAAGELRGGRPAQAKLASRSAALPRRE